MGQDVLLRTLNRYKDLLCNLTRKNKEFFYKESSQSVSLSSVSFPKEFKSKDKFLEEFKPISLADKSIDQLIDNGK